MPEYIAFVVGLPLTCNPIKIKLRFESECKVHIESIKVEADCAEVKLANEKDCKTFCDNLPLSIRFGNDEHTLTLLKKYEIAPSALNNTPVASLGANWSYSELQTWSSLEKTPSCKWGLLVQPTTKAISREDVTKYFENNALSCGGEIATIIPMIDGIFITFKDEAVAEKIWNFRPHRIGGKAVMTYLKVVPTTYQDKLILKGAELEPEKLKPTLEQCSNKNLSMKKIKLFSTGACLVVYDSNIGEEDMHRILEEYKEKVPGMKVSFLVKTDCVHVKNVPEDMTECEIRLLFENSERTGGGEVTRIDYLENANFLIYFASYADAERVGEKVISVFGKTLAVRRYYHDLYIEHKKLWKPNLLDTFLTAWLDQKEKWSNDMVKKNISIIKPGAADFFESEDGKSLVLKARQKFRCSITVASKSQVENQGEKKDFAAAGSRRSSISFPIDIGPLKVSLRQGDITEETNDAIVNSIGPNFDLSVGALSRAIARKGGTSIQSELTKFARNHLFTTTGGNLKCNWIIHVVLPSDLKRMEKSIVDILREAEKCGSKSISIPGIGTGIGELHSCKVAKMMLQSFREFVKKPSQIEHLKVLDVVLFDELQLEDFKEVFSSANEDVDVLKTGQQSRMSSGFTRNQSIAKGLIRPYTGNLAVSVRQGDITEETNDAIVNSTNAEFNLSHGMVSKAIVRKGGDQIQREVYTAKGDLIRVTSGGKLKCKKIIHMVASRDMEMLGGCIVDMLNAVKHHRCTSVSVPAIGTGNLEFPVACVARIMLKAIQEFERYNSDLKFISKVDFVIYDKEQMKEFRDAFFASSLPQAEHPNSKTNCVEVEAVSLEIDEAEQALKYIQDQLDEALGCVIYDDAINKLTDNEERYLRDCEKKYHVRVHRSDGRILIEGQRDDAFRAKDMVKRILKEVAMDNEILIWEYHDDTLNGWQQFGTAQCYELEKLFHESPKSSHPRVQFIDFKGGQQTVDFSKMLIGTYTKIRRNKSHDNQEKI